MKHNQLQFNKLSDMGIYTYIGFAITQKATTELGKEIKNEETGEMIPSTVEQKAIMSFFFQNDKDEIFYINNNEILDHSEDKPHGVFQAFVGTFNSSYNIEFNENFDYVINGGMESNND